MDNRTPFEGFHPPISSTTYTPNQFFDVVLRRGSRGAVRLVAYLIRKTLGWCDAHGQPQEAQVTVSFRELEEHAGIGHSAIAAAVKECVDALYIEVVRVGQPDAKDVPAITACYSLRWDDRNEYVTDPARFRGFYAGNGNLTYIPNQFFDDLVPNETLSVLRVVGAVIRHTIGFQTRYGFRRQEVRMSHADLRRHTRLSPEAVRLAVREALDRNYVVRLEEGVFDPDAGKESRPATYGIRWLDGWNGQSTRALTVRRKPVPDPVQADGPDQPGGEPLRNVVREHSDSQHGDRSEKWHGREITGNNTLKQQQADCPTQTPVDSPQQSDSPAAAHQETVVSQLMGEGFDLETAQDLAGRHSADCVSRQCTWLPRRNPRSNRLGLLRKAIEGDWPEPPVLTTDDTPGAVFASGFYSVCSGANGAQRTKPSAADVQASSTFLDRMAEACADVTPAFQWGIEFSKHAGRHCGRRRWGAGSLAGAIQDQGDEFLHVCRERLKKAQRRDLVAARQRHQVEHGTAYQAYLQAAEAMIRSDHPSAFGVFEAAEREQRGNLQTGFVACAGLTERMLEAFDREEERLTRFRLHFAGHPEHPVQDFWGWDERLNPKPFMTPRVSPITISPPQFATCVVLRAGNR